MKDSYEKIEQEMRFCGNSAQSYCYLREQVADWHDRLAALRASGQKAEPDIKALVDRFLGWKLPKDFAPDAGILFKPETLPSTPQTYEGYWPVGTNLLTADQARRMFEYVLAAAPASADQQGWQPIETAPEKKDIWVGGGGCPSVHVNRFEYRGSPNAPPLGVLSGLGTAQQPTHWKPYIVPPPPTGEG